MGLKGGETYDFKITLENGQAYSIEDVKISSYDRSGYAHFNYYEGVGAYNDDGTLKSGAQVIYVTEETKNTVTANLGGRNYTGLVEILGNLSKATTPVAVRIIGQISAATWKPLDGAANEEVMAEIIDYMEEKGLSRFSQEEIISLGYNTLDTSVYSALDGLSNRINYSGGELDSAYNNCAISNAVHVTLEGIGEDAEIFQWGLTWSNCESIEVRNITFDDYTEDACSFEGSTNATTTDGFDSNNIWVHNNTINEGINYWDVTAEQDKHEGDGGTDFKRSAYITVSYNHYYKNHKTGLIGGSDSQTTACVTFHHNWYEDCNSRLPLGRQANMHMYNNYYDGSTGTNMSLRAGAYAFIENCYFDNAKNPVTTQDGDGKRGVAKIYGCIFSGQSLDEKSYNVTVVTDRAQKVENDNVFAPDFDTNGKVFYYSDGKSDVENMLTAEETKELVPELAGVMRRNDNIDAGGSVTDPEEPTEPDEPENPEPPEETVEAVTSVMFDSYVNNLTDEILQGDGKVYFNADGTVSTTATEENSVISWYGNNTSVLLKTSSVTIGGKTYTNGMQTGGSSNSARRYFEIDLSRYVGKTVTISAYATHTSGTASDEGRCVYVYGSAEDIGSSTEYLAISPSRSMGNKDLVTVTYTLTVTAENCTLYVASDKSIIIYGVELNIS